MVFDQLAVAAEAVAFGSSNESHWQTLAAFAQRDGIDHVAAQLARYGDARGPTRAWWRCTLLLSMEIAAEDSLRLTRELVAIEEAGGGPAFNCERHALQVRGAIQYLEAHLRQTCAGTASSLEQSAAEMVVQAARIARARTAPQPRLRRRA